MGVIFKQSFKGTVYSYSGVLLGFVITGLMLPNFFSTSEVGLFRVLISYGTLFAQVANLGLNSVTVKLFPSFRDKSKKHHGFLGFLFLIGLFGLILSTGLYLLLTPYLIEDAAEKSELFITYIYYVLPLIAFTLLFNLLDTYYRVLYNAVKGIFYKEIIQRLLILASILLFYFGTLDFGQTVAVYILANILPSIILFITVIRNKIFFVLPSKKLFKKDFLKEFISISFFGFMNSFSGVLALNIDIIMITSILGISDTGIYTITFFFGSLIVIPSRPLIKISSVVASDAWKNNNLDVIRDIYHKSSLTLTLIGLFILAGIWGNIDNVFHIVKADYLPGKYVILIIGLAFVLDLLTGTGRQIIFNSKYYKHYSTYLFLYVVALIILNFVFIPAYGIIGAAIATLAAKFALNLAIALHMFIKHKIFTYTYHFLLLFLFAAIAYFISTLLPALNNFIIDIIVRSLLIALIYLLPVIGLRLSPDLNQNLTNIAKKLFRKD